MRGRSVKWQTWAENMVVGKLALHDVLALEPYFDNGYIAQPRCLTPWVQHRMVSPTGSRACFSRTGQGSIMS